MSEREFEDLRALVLALKRPEELPPGTLFMAWSELYVWLRQESERSSWARRAARYMEVLESKMVADDYLKEGTLTRFSGIPFDSEENPHNYREAKRLLGLAMGELPERSELAEELGVDLEAEGRPKISGKGGRSVWDILRLQEAPDETLSKVVDGGK